MPCRLLATIPLPFPRCSLLYLIIFAPRKCPKTFVHRWRHLLPQLASWWVALMACVLPFSGNQSRIATVAATGKLRNSTVCSKSAWWNIGLWHGSGRHSWWNKSSRRSLSPSKVPNSSAGRLTLSQSLRLAAFETQGCPHESKVLKAPRFLSTLVKLWFHTLRHGGSPAALRDTAFSLILFDSINFSTVDGFEDVLDQVADILKDTPDAVTICCTHIFNVIQCNTVNMRLLDGPFAFVAYAMEFHDLLSPLIACRLPSLITSVMVHLTSSKLLRSRQHRRRKVGQIYPRKHGRIRVSSMRSDIGKLVHKTRPSLHRRGAPRSLSTVSFQNCLVLQTSIESFSI
ncbi:hypothetical protein IW262DRAFT_166541 [Armillaria fumosa]|nr:hypothetical protein IW262DRAFT_166541 [Armillaria fumosa]